MSTRSTIAAITKDGKIKEIYCHSMGYLENVGKILVNHYSDLKKANQLVELGDISRLGENIEPSEAILRFGCDYTSNEEFNALPEDEQEKLYHDYQKHVVACHRDRGESINDNRYKVFDNLPQYLDFMKKGAQEFNYLLAFNSERKPQWYLLQNEGFMPLIYDPEYTNHLHNAINIANFDKNDFVKKLHENRSEMIQEFLRCIGMKYHLGYNRSKEVRIGKYKGEYHAEYYDPSTNACIPIRFMESLNPASVTMNFTHFVLKEITMQIKEDLHRNYPLYTKKEAEKLSQIVDLKNQITTFYRKKFDPDDAAFEYFSALCHDQALKDQADEDGTAVMDWLLKAEKQKCFVKSYVLKKVDKLFSDLKESKVKGININYRDIALYTEYSVETKWGESTNRSKFDDYFGYIEQGINPVDESLFVDPLLNSQLYAIFNGLYQKELIKDMEHKLDQATVLQSN